MTLELLICLVFGAVMVGSFIFAVIKVPLWGKYGNAKGHQRDLLRR